MPKFHVTFYDTFHSSELYDHRGAYIYDLHTATREADRQFGDTWSEVYNGLEGVERA